MHLTPSDPDLCYLRAYSESLAVINGIDDEVDDLGREGHDSGARQNPRCCTLTITKSLLMISTFAAICGSQQRRHSGPGGRSWGCPVSDLELKTRYDSSGDIISLPLERDTLCRLRWVLY